MPRNINVSAKPATKAAKATVAKAASAARATVSAEAVAVKPVRGVTRTAATIVAQATNFGSLSDRDTAYLAFYAGIAKRGNGTVTLDHLATSGGKPAYTGSAKPHDAGVIVRLTKAGLITPATDGRGFTFTKAALTHAAYVAG